MAGLYIHIPFCKSRCAYCGFYSTTALDLRQRYVDALCQEMAFRAGKSTESIATIYLGGGTPSVLTHSQLRQIFEAAYIYNKVERGAEVTIECNPDDVTPDFAEGLTSLPVNRVSLGAQTFSDQRLRFCNRRHTASQTVCAVETLRAAGFLNISIDLIYGFPGETLADWEADIQQVIDLEPEHISTYCLTYEEGTPLFERYRRYEERGYEGAPRKITEEEERRMYYRLIDLLEAEGYEHYEISNFARPGFRSRHNSGYWNGTPYLGIGAAAHSYDVRSRSWNVADIHRYMEGIEAGQRPFEEELIDDDTRYNDAVTVCLRTSDGLRLSQFSGKYRSYCLREAQPFIADGLIEKAGDPESPTLRLTRRALFVSDMIMSALIYLP